MAPTHSTPVFALLTDFGTNDPYVGVMKGVLLSRARSVHIVDITHAVAPQNVRHAAYLLWSAYRFFPQGTIFVSVVDPGVGTDRPFVILKTKRHWFLSPDNGTLSFVSADEPSARWYQVSDAALRRLELKPRSATFHGRDLLAPLAAALARSGSIRSLGGLVRREPAASPFVTNATSAARPSVLHIDRFGNVVTNLRLVATARQPRVAIRIGRRRIRHWATTFAGLPDGVPGLVIGSSGLVEIVIDRRSAAIMLGLSVGDELRVEWER